jgi:hypothetical protein
MREYGTPEGQRYITVSDPFSLTSCRDKMAAFILQYTVEVYSNEIEDEKVVPG